MCRRGCSSPTRTSPRSARSATTPAAWRSRAPRRSSRASRSPTAGRSTASSPSSRSAGRSIRSGTSRTPRRRRRRPAPAGARRPSAPLQLRLLLVRLELLLLVLEVVLRRRARGAGVVADLEALDHLVAGALVERDVVADEDPVAAFGALLEDVLVHLRRVVDDEQHLGLRVEVRAGAVEDVLEVEAAGRGHSDGLCT